MKKQITTKDFESRLFKSFVLPGIALEVLLLLLFCVPTGLTINLLRHSIGGPRGIVASFAMNMYYQLLTEYLLVAGIYSVILFYRYYRRREKFITSARRFLMYSCVWIVIMDVMVALGFVEFVRWNLDAYMNIPVVVVLTCLAGLMTVFFIYWTRQVYKSLGLKVISKTGITSALVSLLLIFLIYLVPYALMFLIW